MKYLTHYITLIIQYNNNNNGNKNKIKSKPTKIIANNNIYIYVRTTNRANTCNKNSITLKTIVNLDNTQGIETRHKIVLNILNKSITKILLKDGP